MTAKFMDLLPQSIKVGAVAGCVLAALATGASGPASAEAAFTVVNTEYGAVRGASENGVRTYLGIPFAAAPVGPLRWERPQAPEPWSNVRNAVQFGNTCAQNKRLGDFADASTSEDCLFVNVFAPEKKAAGKKRPVMVWIHGGGLFVGQSDGHDGGAFVRNEDVVFVSFNYRLHVLGFLAHPALSLGGRNVNFGLLDQQFALKWVKRNIEAFGGDPDNVTIFGESAGGQAVAANLASPRARGLFDRAIIESSGAGFYSPPTSPPASLIAAEQNGKAFAAAVGCDDQTAACLKNVPIEKILEQEASFARGLVVDGFTLPKSLREAFESGEFNRVPILSGTNRDEYRWFQAFEEKTTGHVITADEYPDRLSTVFGPDLAELVGAKYPLSDFNSPSEALAAARGDRQFICASRGTSLLAAKFVPVFYYEFADRKAPNFETASFPYGAYHTSEIQYIFPGYKGVFDGPAPTLSKQQKQLSAQMISYWANFAKAGNPNSRTLPQWPRFRNDLVMSLRTPDPITIKTLGQDHNCGFWDKVGEGFFNPSSARAERVQQ